MCGGRKVRVCVERALAALAWAGALWPLWRWLGARLAEPLDAGIAAWAALALLIVDEWRRAGWKAHAPGAVAYLAAACGLALFWGLRPFLPITLCGAFGVVGGLPILLPGARDQGVLPVPLAGLAVAGLPSLLVADMFLGVPLRLVSSVSAATLLRLAGFDVARNGMEIAVGGVPVWVDAPCAGVKMLGAGIVAVLVIAQIWRLGFWCTALTAVAAVAAVCAANAARVAVLTVFAASGRALGAFAHEMVGCVALAFALFVVASMPRCGFRGFGVRSSSFRSRNGRSNAVAKCASVMAFVAAAAVCIAFRLPPRESLMPAADFPGWPERFEGEMLEEETLGGFERKFAKSFQGKIGRFRVGRRMVIIRWTPRVTHRVHGAAYCLEATGWNIGPRPLEVRADGAWSAFSATRGTETLYVREQVRDASGSTFADVPAWFFSAFLGRSAGPWWIVTVASKFETRRVQN
jgi:exosortase/archaeosortase family protein